MSNSDAKVFVTRRRVPEAIDLLGQHFDVEAWEPNSPPPPDVLLEKAAQSDALLTEADDKVHAGVLEAAPSLKVVANRGVGVDNIDIPAATRCGVLVGNTPDILQESCADFTFGLMIAAARRIVHADRQVQAGRWTKFDPMPYVGHDVHGKTLGIVGLGAIGEAVARRAQGFGMTVLYYSRTRKPQAEDALGVLWAPDLKQLMRDSDFVSVHVPLSDETRGIVGEAELAEMKPTAFLVNTSRGPTVDPKALYASLSSGSIAGAALDVTDPEPLPTDDPLMTLPNVVITPHIAPASGTTITRMGLMATRNIIAALNGEPMPSCLNPEAAASRRAP